MSTSGTASTDRQRCRVHPEVQIHPHHRRVGVQRPRIDLLPFRPAAAHPARALQSEAGEDRQIFVECGNAKKYWYEDPLFIFDDTLLHRSVNEHDGRRYCVFMDIIRPSPVPRSHRRLLAVVSVSVERMKAMFYKNWKMIGSRNPKAAPVK